MRRLLTLTSGMRALCISGCDIGLALPEQEGLDYGDVDFFGPGILLQGPSDPTAYAVGEQYLCTDMYTNALYGAGPGAPTARISASNVRLSVTGDSVISERAWVAENELEDLWQGKLTVEDSSRTRTRQLSLVVDRTRDVVFSTSFQVRRSEEGDPFARETEHSFRCHFPQGAGG